MVAICCGGKIGTVVVMDVGSSASLGERARRDRFQSEHHAVLHDEF